MIGAPLLVGGIGIFNIMSSSVTERTHEIGILKAIGARNKDIMQQFLMEAAIISLLGGVFGVLLGFMIFIALMLWFGILLSPAWSFLLIGLLVSIVVGIFSGYYPAKKAAGMTPLIALRYD